MFNPVGSKVDFPAMEQKILAWWQENSTVERYLKRNRGSEQNFSFIDGPITANNPMGVHHAWGRTYKDLFQRYKTMQGFKQRYQNGFDGQGLWIEVEVEKELGMNSKRDIEVFGVDKFVELCKDRVRKFAAVQTRQSVRLGYWMNWADSYHTMSDENNYTIWHFLKVCHQRGLIYQGTDVMPWCPRCGTGLSQHEIVTEGYKEIVHPGLYVRFPLADRQGEALLGWTTTPWTLTANTGVAVHPELTYAKVRSENTSPDGSDEVLYLLKDRLSELKSPYRVLEKMPGKSLIGLAYRGPFDELPVQHGVEHCVVGWDEVNQNEGTGIVHTAPGAGSEDFALSKKVDLATIAPLDEFGLFVEGFDWLSGKSVLEVNDLVYDSLREKGLFFRLEDYSHRYPVCWRCDTELVYRLVDEWFISMDELRDEISAVTRKISWVPEFGMERELDWLRNMDDWMISKKRYWGLALPIYKCGGCGHFEVIGSETELKERAVEGWEQFQDHSPHRPWIDAVKIKCAQCDAMVSRIQDVGNPWLDAGIVPFSTLDYRQDRDHWREWFPADWVSESFPGQFRNWFYSLLTMSTVLENTEPFRNLFSYAVMRDERGEEMHKSKGNAIEFEDGAQKMGVDAMRWLYARHNPAANLNFGYGTADEVRRRFLIPLWNVYSFFITYANIDGYDPTTVALPANERPELDRWILSELNTLIDEVSRYLDTYEPDSAAHAVEAFVDYLSNWYVRRSRRRFWKSDTDEDKLAAYATLYECLVSVIKLTAPFIPFVTEEMYQNLVVQDNKSHASVHLESYPQSDPSTINEALSSATRLAMRLSSMGRAARSKAGIKVRQPVDQIAIKLRSTHEAALLEQVEAQIRDELNVKNLSSLENIGEVSKFDVEADMSVVGPKYGAQTPEVLSALAAADHSWLQRQISTGQVVELDNFTLEPESFQVTSSDLPGYSVVSESGYTVAVTTEISSELAAEGTAREFVHLIQNMRRDAGFEIADYITTYYKGDDLLDNMLVKHRAYIQEETLSRELVKGPPPAEAYVKAHKINDLRAVLGVTKAVQQAPQ